MSLTNGSAAPSDRIIAWRQGIASSPSIADGGGKRRGSSKTGDGSRNSSPRKSVEQSPASTPQVGSREQRGSDGSVRQQQHPLAQQHGTPPPTSHPYQDTNTENHSHSPSPQQRNTPPPALSKNADREPSTSTSPDPNSPNSTNPTNPLLLRADGQSDLFYDSAGWTERAARVRQMHELHGHALEPVTSRASGSFYVDASGGDGNGKQLRPELRRGETRISELSDERRSEQDEGQGEGEGEEFSDAPETLGEAKGRR